MNLGCSDQEKLSDPVCLSHEEYSQETFVETDHQKQAKRQVIITRQTMKAALRTSVTKDKTLRTSVTKDKTLRTSVTKEMTKASRKQNKTGVCKREGGRKSVQVTSRCYKSQKAETKEEAGDVVIDYEKFRNINIPISHEATEEE